MSHQRASGPALVIRHTGQVFPLTGATITIGRQADNTIVLADQQVSRHHASLSWQSGGYVVQDLGSANGTFVNERQIAGPQRLRHGDVLRLGNTHFEVQLAPDAGPTQQAPAGYDAAADGGRRSLAPVIVGLLLVSIVAVGLAIAAILLLAGGGRGAPTVAIQSPPAGAQVEAGREILLQATAAGARDITRLELNVDGVLVGVAASADARGQASLTVSQPWTFGQPGPHTVSAQAFTARGRSSERAAAGIVVGGGVAQVTPSATPEVTPGAAEATLTPSTTPLPTVAPPPTDTSEPPPNTPPDTPPDTPTPTPTSTPTNTSTPTRTPTPTNTPISTPQIEYFRANPSVIASGGCSTLEWGAVTNATEATIDQGIGGVGTPGTRNVCPAETTTYILTATGPGGVTTASATVTVTAAKPDLIVVALAFVPSPPVRGQNNEVRITLRNQGSTAAGAFNWELQPGPEPVLAGNVAGGLGAGETMIVTAVWNPASTYPNVSVTARVDTTNAVDESDETNNTLTVNTPVVAPASVTVTRTSQAHLDGFRANNNGGNSAVDIRAGNGAFVGSPSFELVTRGFMSFDLAGIPAGATVQSIELRFYQVNVAGNPYGKLGNPQLIHVNYGDSLDGSAYDTPALSAPAILSPHTGAGQWYVITSDTLGAWIEQDLSAGRTRIQMRLQFSTETDGDGGEDVIYIESGDNHFGTGNVPELTITYIP